jgi:hypothetical protein
MLSNFTLVQLGRVHAQLVGKDRPTKFPSKDKATEVVRAKLAEAGKQVIVIEDSGEPELIDAPAGFQKATKDELAAMSKSERAAYRKARRKAAREKRKAVQ